MPKVENHQQQQAYQQKPPSIDDENNQKRYRQNENEKTFPVIFYGFFTHADFCQVNFCKIILFIILAKIGTFFVSLGKITANYLAKATEISNR
jgi:hypothetical protein